MNRGSGRSGGFTIVETLIFLAVSGLLSVSAIVMVANQRGKTQFSQSVQDFVSRMQDVANDVSTGLSGFDIDTTCNLKTANQKITTGMAPPIPANERCIFLGKVIQLGVGADQNKVTIYPVVGVQRTAASGGREVTNLDEAVPTALAPGGGATGSNPDYSSSFQIGDGVKVTSVKYGDTVASMTATGAIGFLTTFQSYTASSLSSGASGVDAWAIGGGITDTSVAMIGRINDYAKNPPGSGHYPKVNPILGFRICLKSQSTNQFAVVSVGGTDATAGLKTGRLTVSSKIQDADCT